AVKDAGLKLRLNVVTDGVEALDYLRRQGRHQKAQRPDLVLLDLNMPRKDGREVIAEVKADEALRSIPIVVLTTSGADSDLAKALFLGANCYVVKPADFSKFREAIRAIDYFWGAVARLPTR